MARASGLALTRPPLPATGDGGAGAGAAGAGAAARGGGAAAGAAGGGGGVAATGAGAGAGAATGAGALAKRAEMSSFASAITPISAPIGALPPAGTRILRSTPAPSASISMLALSVSISARTSPTFTASPSFLLHLTMVPSSIVGDSFANTTLVTLTGTRPS